MKYCRFFTFLLLFSLLQYAALAQAPAIEWQKTYGGNVGDIGDRATCVQQTSDGGYVVAGYAYSSDGDVDGNHGKSDVWILKLNSSGNIVWTKAYGGTSDEYVYCIRQTVDGGYVVAGYTGSSDGDVSGFHGPVDSDYWVIKISATGILQWQKTFGGTDIDVAKSIDVAPDGSYVIAGYTRSKDGDVKDNQGVDALWVIKLGADGTVQWQKTYGTFPHSVAESIRAAKDGGFVIAGNAEYYGAMPGYHGSIDYWIIKINNAGGVEWQNFYGGSASDYAHSIEQTPDGGYIVSGTSNSYDGQVTGNHSSNISGATDAWVVKLTSTGSLEWQKCLGGSYVEEGFSVKAVPGGGYVVAAAATSTDGDLTTTFYSRDVWIVKLANDGNIEWQKSYGGSGHEEPNWIECTTDDGFVVAGWTNSGANDGDVTHSHYGNDYWVVKLKPVPCMPDISIATSSTTICTGTAVDFTATVSYEGPDPRYQWTINGVRVGGNSSRFSSLTLAQGDVVACMLISNAACSLTNDSAISNSIKVTVINTLQPTVSIVASDSSICPRAVVTFHAMAQNAGASHSYQWLVNGAATYSNTPTYTNAFLVEGDLVQCKLDVPNSVCGSGSALSGPITIRVNPLPVIQLFPVDTLVTSGTHVQIHATVFGPLASFTWAPAAFLEDTFSLMPQTKPLSSSLAYQLNIFSPEGCLVEAAGKITVEGGVYMPSAFSPNHDGVNDVFRIPASTSITLQYFSIYNRWGQEIFRTTDAAKGWDGTVNGRPVEAGVFVYAVSGKLGTRDKVFTGTVTLVR